jgi:hypothetical protein
LVSGESELNHIINGNKSINQLYLGEASYDRPEEWEYVPLYSLNEDRIFNSHSVTQQSNGTLVVQRILNVNSIRFQPYLHVIINKIIEACGYVLNSNVIETSYFKYLYIVNGKRTSRYNEMLPNWTVVEFIEEIEKLFNVVFIIDEYTKKIDIIFKYNYYKTAPKHFINKIFDSYSQEIDTENKTDYSNANTGYDLTDDEYYRYQKLDSELLNKIEYITLNSYIAIVNHINGTSDKRSLINKIFISLKTNTQYIMWATQDSNGAVSYDARKVNILRNLRNNPESSDVNITFKICPAPIRLIEINVIEDDGRYDPDDVLYQMIAPMPAIETDLYNPRGSEDGTEVDLQEILESDSSVETEDNSSTKMLVAFYNGYHTIFEKVFSSIAPRNVDYPIGFVDYLREDQRLGEYAIDQSYLSLRLDDPHGLKEIYGQSNPIDTTRQYAVKFVHDKKLDTKTIFVIANKQFVCKELRFRISPKGMDKIVEGVFYPIN